MAFKAKQHVILIHAAAIVRHPDQAGAVAFNLDVYAVGPGIKGVFQQFLDRRGGPLDDLASSNAAGKLIREDAYFGHGVVVEFYAI